MREVIKVVVMLVGAAALYPARPAPGDVRQLVAAAALPWRVPGQGGWAVRGTGAIPPPATAGRAAPRSTDGKGALRT
jgi:hypothetical protein